MSTLIVRIGESYFGWSTVARAPTTFAMTRAEAIAWRIRKDPDRREDQIEWTARLDEKGTTSIHDESAAASIADNRAGPDESCLSTEEIERVYANQTAYDAAEARSDGIAQTGGPT